MKKFYRFNAVYEDIAYGDTPQGVLFEQTEEKTDVQVAYPSGEGEERLTIDLPPVKFEIGRFSERLFSIVVTTNPDNYISEFEKSLAQLENLRPSLRRRVKVVFNGIIDHIMRDLANSMKKLLQDKHQHRDCDCMSCRPWTS